MLGVLSVIMYFLHVKLHLTFNCISFSYQVFGMAILLSLILKNPAEEDEGEEEDETVEMGDDEEFLHSNDG